MKQTQNLTNDQRRRPSRHLLQWGWLPLCLALLGTGCKQQAKVAVHVNPAGTYTLVSVNGNNVPCTVDHDGHKLAVKSGSFIINADGTCSSKVVFTPPSGTDATREVKAAYTRDGSTLTMKWEGAGTTTGTVDGSNFSMNNEGMIFAYRK